MNSFSRRKLLSNTGHITAAAFVPAIVNAGNADAPVPHRPISRKLKVIVTGGHPGDPEYGCGGTIARYTDLGHEVILLYLNRGGAGSPKLPAGELSALRTAEATKACEILKARPAYAGQVDGNAIVDATHYEEFRKLFQAERPDVVLTQWPIDSHPDHRATSMLAYDAWLHMGKSFGFYYYEVSDGEDTQMFSPTAYVDITAVEPRKRAACYAHASQTPDRYYALETQVARFRGIESGHAQAEAFIRHVQSPDGLLPAEL
jgi:N-acetylglucosamine malate deacetylase 1